MSTQEKKSCKTRKLWITLCLMIVGILVFSMLAGLVHTGFGTVKIWDIKYMTQEGGYQRALLYVPKSVSSSNPAPAIVACHGFNNTAEVQDINAIELARRGYVVISIDAYRHGLSSEPNLNIDSGGGAGLFGEMNGVYSALQYLGTLPYVDTDNIGMVGHSMGGGNIQNAALMAFEKQKTDPTVIVPKAVAPTANSFYLGDDGDWILSEYNVNGADVLAQFEEFAGTGNKGIDAQLAMQSMFGFVPEYDEFYVKGNSTPLTRDEAVAAAKRGELRVLYMTYGQTHPGVHFSNKAITNLVDFFDITLRGGNATIPAGNNIWALKHIFSGIALLLFILIVIPIGGLLLQTPYFGTLVRPEPESYSIAEKGKGMGKYILLFIVGLLPAMILYYFCMNWGIILTALGSVFPLYAVNGIALLNIFTAIIGIILFTIYYKTMYKKNGATKENMGLRLPFKQVMKGLLLAVIAFLCAYSLLVIVDYFFKVDFRFWVFSYRVITPVKWTFWLRYIPFYFIFFLVNGLTMNMTTRIRGKSEKVNTLLCFLSSFAGLLVLCLVDYLTFFANGAKLPFFAELGGASTSLSGILLWGVIFILPLASLISRYFFKKTGSVWVGAFVNSCVVTLFAISNTVVMFGPLY